MPLRRRQLVQPARIQGAPKFSPGSKSNQVFNVIFVLRSKMRGRGGYIPRGGGTMRGSGGYYNNRNSSNYVNTRTQGNYRPNNGRYENNYHHHNNRYSGGNSNNDHYDNRNRDKFNHHNSSTGGRYDSSSSHKRSYVSDEIQICICVYVYQI